MAQAREEEAVGRVISQLGALGYDGLDSFEPAWVRSVLVSATGGQRQNLLLWVLRQLSPSTALDLQAAPQHTHMQRILQSLSCMGICQTGDVDVIEGTAPVAAQLKFWQACLDNIENLRQFSGAPAVTQRRHTETANSLLHHLAYSPHLHPTLQQGLSLNFVPGDLVKRQRVWARQGHHTPVADSLQQARDQLHHHQQQYDQLEEKWKVECCEEERVKVQSSVCEGVSKLTQQQTLLQGVYTSYIAPWITSKPQLELSEVGPHVHQARGQLDIVTQALQVMGESVRRCEELDEQEIKHHHSTSTHTPSVITKLHALTTTHNQA